jgi:hypothetical protein
MYVKVFRQMYEGSLATVGPWEAMVTFQQFLILADRFGDVDMTPEVISRLTTIPLDVIRRGIEALTQPDDQSRTPDEDGRRLVLIDERRSWGWRVVNYGKYAAIRSAEERRDYKRRWIKAKRKLSTVDNVDNVGPSDSDSYSYSDKGERGANAPRSPRKARKTCPEEWQPSAALLAKISAEEVEACLARGGTTVAMELERLRSCTFGTARIDWDKTAWNWLLTECKKINQKEVMYGANRQAQRR